MRKRISVILVAVVLVGGICVSTYAAEGGGAMIINSPEFKHNGFIPAKFTCEGSDINPSLIIEDIPKDAKSLVLIVDDPDAPAGTWAHWVVFDMPVTSTIKEDSVPGKQGINSSGRKGYHGPCPPSGVHRYFFKIYALDTVLNLQEGISKKELESAMSGHISGKAELIGLYKRGR